MGKKLIILLLIAFQISCKNDKKEQKQDATTTSEQKDTVSAAVAKNTFLVVTSIAASDKQQFLDHAVKQTDQIDSLYNKGIVENIYYKTDTKFGKNDLLPTVVFFVKANSEADAKQILNKTDFIKYNVGKYELREVGTPWFGVSDKSGAVRLEKQNVFGVEWNLNKEASKIDNQIIEDQVNQVAQLYKEGIFENAYLNVSDKDTKNPAIFFMNAKDENEAKKVLDNLPMTKSKNGSYKIHPVGNFMKGKPNN
jgi:hypothetical protein